MKIEDLFVDNTRSLIKFEVNKEKRIVAAIITDLPSVVIKKIAKLDNRDESNFEYFADKILCSKRGKLPSKIVAIAKCHPNDEWDEEIGKKLARERVYRMLDKYVIATINRINKFFARCMFDASNYKFKIIKTHFSDDDYSKYDVVTEIKLADVSNYKETAPKIKINIYHNDKYLDRAEE